LTSRIGKTLKTGGTFLMQDIRAPDSPGKQSGTPDRALAL